MKKTEYTAEEKKAYFAQQKKAMEEALVKGVQAVYTSENYCSYLKTMLKFHNYSINNCILIAMQCPEATKVAGFNDWSKKFHRHVLKGAKAIKILAPMFHKGMVEEKGTDGKITVKETEWTTYRAVNVFDISQTDGEELPEICKPLTASVENYDEIIAKLINISQYPVSYEDIDFANGYFDSKNKKVVVKQGMSNAQTIKTLVHEITHSILHDDAFCEIPKEVKEIQAESVAYMVCQEIGIDTASYSFEYVATWAKEDMKVLTAQMDIVRKTADSILAKM